MIDNRQFLISKAYLSLQLRWAQKTIKLFDAIKNKHKLTNKYVLDHQTKWQLVQI